MLPVKLGKTKVLEEHWHRLFVVRDGQFLCGKRPISGIWPGLMDLPQPNDLGMEEAELEAWSAGGPVEHRLSHRKLWIHFYRLGARDLTGQPDGFEWVALDNWEDLAWPVPVGRWLKKNSTFG
jgi:adenine-specific DNA glycosylase